MGEYLSSSCVLAEAQDLLNKLVQGFRVSEV